MNHICVKNLALIVAAQARIEGMKAENQHRLACGESIAYGEDAFLHEAAGLTEISREVAEWGWQP